MTLFEKFLFFFGVMPKRFVRVRTGKYYQTWYNTNKCEYWVLEMKTGRFFKR